jgi:hypothetical protein
MYREEFRVPVVRFPIRARLARRLGIENATPTNALTLELRQIDIAIAALKKRRTEVISLYHQEIKKLSVPLSLIAASFVRVQLTGVPALCQALEGAHHSAYLLLFFR